MQSLMDAVKVLPQPKIILNNSSNHTLNSSSNGSNIDDADNNEKDSHLNNNQLMTLEQWLKAIQLEEYTETFR